MNKERLIEVLGIQTESYDDFLMYKFLTDEFKARGLTFYDEYGSLYVTKGKSSAYPCVVAHMDTVHEIVEDLTVIQVKNNLTGFNAVRMEQTGIGGDDKVGVYIALECLDKFENIKAAFFCDEEVGCRGSYQADPKFFKDCAYVLQCDRNGNKDFITVASGSVLSSKAFRKDIERTISAFGYKFCEFGMMTDVMALKEIGTSISMANISCGYYNPHSSDEYVNIDDVANCQQMVYSIIEVLGEVVYHHAPERKNYYYRPSYSKSVNLGFSETEADNEDKYGDIVVHECECCGNTIKDQNDLHYLRDFNNWVCGECYTWAKQYDDDEKKYEAKKKSNYYDRYETLW